MGGDVFALWKAASQTPSAEIVRVMIDIATMLTLDRTPGTIVYGGNTGTAGAKLSDERTIVPARTTVRTTNLIVFDRSYTEISNPSAGGRRRYHTSSSCTPEDDGPRSDQRIAWFCRCQRQPASSAARLFSAFTGQEYGAIH